MSFFDVFSGAPYGSDFLILTKEIIKKMPKRKGKEPDYDDDELQESKSCQIR